MNNKEFFELKYTLIDKLERLVNKVDSGYEVVLIEGLLKILNRNEFTEEVYREISYKINSFENTAVPLSYPSSLTRTASEDEGDPSYGYDDIAVMGEEVITDNTRQEILDVLYELVEEIDVTERERILLRIYIYIFELGNIELDKETLDILETYDEVFGTLQQFVGYDLQSESLQFIKDTFSGLLQELSQKGIGRKKFRFRTPKGGKRAVRKMVRVGYRAGKKIKPMTRLKLKRARKRNKAKMKRIMRQPGRIKKAKLKRRRTFNRFKSGIKRQAKLTKKLNRKKKR